MASIKYYIEKRRDGHGRLKTRNIPILLFFSFDGKRLQLNTGEKVNAGDWDGDKQMVRPGVPGGEQVNRYLKALGKEVMSIYREARLMGLYPGLSYLREELKYRRRKDNVDFFAILMRFIDENHDQWSIYTFRKIRTVYNHLRTFADTEQITIEFNRIDEDFLNRYVRFFRVKYDHSNSTIAKNLDVLKWFLNWATKRGYNKSLLYREYELTWNKNPRIRQEELLLDWDELMKLNEVELSLRSLKEVRDIFCFMCFSGLKLQRVYQIRTTNIYLDHIRMPGNGDGELFDFPVNRRAAAILEDYRERHENGVYCFPRYQNSYFNSLLKKAGKEAGINRFVNIEVHSGTETGIQQVPKYEILSSKFAVNTFLYNGLRLGISAEVLSYVTGQKTLHGVERIRSILESTASLDIRKFDTLDQHSF